VGDHGVHVLAGDLQHGGQTRGDPSDQLLHPDYETVTAASVGNRAPAVRRRREQRRSSSAATTTTADSKRAMREQPQSKRGRDTQAFDQEQEGFGERPVPRRFTDFGPVELLTYRTHYQKQWRKIAIMLGQRLQLGDHDRSRWQDRHADTEHLMITCGVKQGPGDRDASEPVQYIDLCRLLDRIPRVIIVVVGLEKPIFRRPLDPHPRSRQAVGGHVNIGFSHNKIDIVTRLGPAMYPEGVTAAEREGDTVGLQGGSRTLECDAEQRLVGCAGRRR
jgi:hypothetical protein